MDPEMQAMYWLHGIPIHNVARDECCPDFSCCHLSSLVPYAERQRFVTLMQSDDDEGMWAMLGTFLGRALTQEGLRDQVYIAGQGGEAEHGTT